jgi:hypothetical protein
VNDGDPLLLAAMPLSLLRTVGEGQDYRFNDEMILHLRDAGNPRPQDPRNDRTPLAWLARMSTDFAMERQLPNKLFSMLHPSALVCLTLQFKALLFCASVTCGVF